MAERIGGGKPAAETVLSKELSSLIGNETICLIQHDNEGIFFVAKLPSDDIEQIREDTPTQVTTSIWCFPRAPVIEISIQIDTSQHYSNRLYALVNPHDSQQRADFTGLAEQTTFRMHFYDEYLNYRSTKVVANKNQGHVKFYLDIADKLVARNPIEQSDFDKAKTDIESQLIRLEKRKKFKRMHGHEARNLIAFSPTFSDRLSKLSRKQKRAFHHAATDLATIEMYGETPFEEKNKARPGVSRNRHRLRATGFGDELESFFQLAKAASQVITAAYNNKAL